MKSQLVIALCADKYNAVNGAAAFSANHMLMCAMPAGTNTNQQINKAEAVSAFCNRQISGAQVLLTYNNPLRTIFGANVTSSSRQIIRPEMVKVCNTGFRINPESVSISSNSIRTNYETIVASSRSVRITDEHACTIVFQHIS